MKLVKLKSKVAIIGCGFVGASSAYAIAMKGIVSELVLIDVNNDKAVGEAMDLNHGLSFLGQTSIYAGDYSDIKDCDVIVITAGANRKPGESRLDLAHKNNSIIRDVVGNVMKFYNTGVILVVSNPLDLVTYIVQKASGLPANKVFGSGTILDTVRFKYLLSDKLGVDVNSIQGYMIGEHGDSVVPAWSTVTVGGLRFDKYCALNNIKIDKNAILNDVKVAGAEVIKKKGATYYAIALSVSHITETILKNQNSILPLSTVVNERFGIDDVALSLPCILGGEGIVSIPNIEFTPDEIAGLKNSAVQINTILNEIR